MFSRYAFYMSQEELVRTFKIKHDQLAVLNPNYNAGYGDIAPIVIAGTNRERTLVPAKWDTTPFHEIGEKCCILVSDLNKKPGLQKSFQRRRCILTLNGYFEWKKLNENLSIPFYLRMLSQDILGVAGLYDKIVDEGGNASYSFVPFETKSNEIVQPLSDTMPAILDRDDIVAWLDPLISDVAMLGEMVRPIEMLDMASYRVSTEINEREASGRGLIQPIV